ncbi:pyruvate kinase [uncultured Clostridium sp.]|uniref:pyruvate kinase n=1 Tax=uncultured Clostridium sp. TaxID=59620 RepID=UPI0028EADA22|nr:pyruvate kinase [uncultured Clostridium sp.]
MKIICSIGPKVNNIDSIDKLIKSGTDILRFNFSHINYKETETLINYTQKNYKNVSILQDLAGNKIRVSRNFHHQYKVFPGDIVYFCSENDYKETRDGIENRIFYVPISLQKDLSLVKSTKTIYMKDGTMEFEVLDNNKSAIKTVVKRGGMIRKEKGVNAPGMDRRFMGLTEKDKKDILWGLNRGVDIICLSYVCYGENMKEFRDFVNKNSNGKKVKLWAKVESKEGIDNFEEILNESDAVMIGRGDLISEINYEEIPMVQENIIKQIKNSNKNIIIATYILDSMKRNIKPTLSEMSDIYYFVKNGVYAVMLAGEVSVGSRPILTVSTMKKLIETYSK